jgi:hypothetical protein
VAEQGRLASAARCEVRRSSGAVVQASWPAEEQCGRGWSLRGDARLALELAGGSGLVCWSHERWSEAA